MSSCGRQMLIDFGMGRLEDLDPFPVLHHRFPVVVGPVGPPELPVALHTVGLLLEALTVERHGRGRVSGTLGGHALLERGQGGREGEGEQTEHQNSSMTVALILTSDSASGLVASDPGHTSVTSTTTSPAALPV